MSNITVTTERIAHLMATAEWDVKTIFGKCTVVTAKLENGFILVESSACVDPANYDEKLGENICKDKIREKLWELEGYALQKAVYEGRDSEIAEKVAGVFSDAVKDLEQRLKGTGYLR